MSEQLTLKFDGMEKEITRLQNKPEPSPALPAPDNITIPVEIKVNIERDAEKVESKKRIKLEHDEKGHITGARIDNDNV